MFVKTFSITPILLATTLFHAQDPVDDQAFLDSMASQGQTHISANQHVPPEEVMKDLGVKNTTVKLPSLFNLVDSPDQIYERVKKATLVMSVYELCGQCDQHHPNPAGAFLISPDGLAITNHHVMDRPKATGFVAFTHDGKLLRVKKVLAANKDADVALVQLEGSNLPYLPVSPKAVLGERVWTLSHPMHHFYTLTTGIVSRYSARNGTPWLEITADYAVGSSGSPIVNDKGQVVGVASMTHTIKAQANEVQMVRKISSPSSAIHSLTKN